MKAILFKDVVNVGDADTLVNVSNGFARNYLFPNKLAGPATPKALAELGKRQAEKQKELEARRSEFEALAKQLSEIEVIIQADAGEEGKLFGSVTSQDIAIEAAKLIGSELDKKKIQLSEPIKYIGAHTVPVKIFKGISAELKVKVVAK
ncbi:MAG: 50S ribosomal protein L9 [Candidatus Saganbacteria bacterium]|nr:50S ribosomal protein L9 [Candidatus Saganbacteria bacterium]